MPPALVPPGEGARAPRPDVVVVGAGVANLKGTVVVNLAGALAALGEAVHLVDMAGSAAVPLAGPLPWARAPITLANDPAAPAAPGALVLCDPPARFDAAVRALVCAARLVLVPVDASPLALRVLGEVEATLGAAAGDAVHADGPRLRVVLARRLPREVDRWALVERVGALAGPVLAPITLPMARSARVRSGAALLYAPGTGAARAYAALAELVCAELGRVPRPHPAVGAPISTTP